MDISDMRRSYESGELNETDLPSSPKPLFDQWLAEAVESDERDANAMVLSTVDQHGGPSSRVVLAKQVTPEGIIFFTNYDSRKAAEIKVNPRVALNFHWASLDRMVRIEGRAERITDVESDKYFDSRPVGSRRGAIASPQSQVIESRQVLLDEVEKLERSGEEPHRPNNWGGYLVRPKVLEFWQGRPDRLHDRIRYRVVDRAWAWERLAP